MAGDALTGTLDLAAEKALTVAAVRRLLDDSGGTYSVTDEWYETPHGIAVSPTDTNCEFEVKDAGDGPVVAVHKVDNCGDLVTTGVHVFRVDSDERWYKEAFGLDPMPTPENMDHE